MQQLRVVDLAHTMGISARELIFKLRSIGVNVSSEQDTLDLSTVRAIITGETLMKRPREVIVRREKTVQPAQTTSARDRLARRRRRQVIETDREIKEVLTEKDKLEESAKPVMEAPAEPQEIPEVEVVASETADVPTEPEVAPVVEEPAVEAEPEPKEVEKAEVAPAESEPEAEVVEPEPKPEPEPKTADETSTVVPEEEFEKKPTPEVTEEEFTSKRPTPSEDGPKRVQPIRAKTPLERTLRRSAG